MQVYNTGKGLVKECFVFSFFFLRVKWGHSKQQLRKFLMKLFTVHWFPFPFSLSSFTSLSGLGFHLYLLYIHKTEKYDELSLSVRV